MKNKTKTALIVLMAALSTAASAQSSPQFHIRFASKGVQAPPAVPQLGAFVIPPAFVGSSFYLTPPTSTSSGAFTFTSSDPAIASIEGDLVSAHQVGEIQITAAQAPDARSAGARVSASFQVHPLMEPGLSNFTVASRVAGTSFTLTPPTSYSEGAFMFTSSDSTVASVVGDVVTTHKEGSTLITATQAQAGGYSPGSISTSLVVTSAWPSNFVSSGGLIWSRPSQRLNHSQAVAYCSGVIATKTGWRLPTQSQLIALYANRVAAGYVAKGWPVSASQEPYGKMRSSTYGGVGKHMAVSLAYGESNIYMPDENAAHEAYVTCVRNQ